MSDPNPINLFKYFESFLEAKKKVEATLPTTPPPPPPTTKISMDELIRRKTALVRAGGALYRVTCEEIMDT